MKIKSIIGAALLLFTACTSNTFEGGDGNNSYLKRDAAEGPAMMYLMVAIVGVRFVGLGRACARYAERLMTHKTAFHAAKPNNWV